MEGDEPGPVHHDQEPSYPVRYPSGEASASPAGGVVPPSRETRPFSKRRGELKSPDPQRCKSGHDPRSRRKPPPPPPPLPHPREARPGSQVNGQPGTKEAGWKCGIRTNLTGVPVARVQQTSQRNLWSGSGRDKTQFTRPRLLESPSLVILG